MKRAMHLAKYEGRRFRPFFFDRRSSTTSKLVSLRWLAIAAVFFVLTHAASTFAQDPVSALNNLRVEVVSMKSFDDTIKHLKWRFGEHGLVISWASDFVDIVDYERNRVSRVVIFEVLRAKWLQQILDSEPSAALAMPIRVMIIEKTNGETLVSYHRPSVLLMAFTSDELKVLGETIDKKLARIVRLAASE